MENLDCSSYDGISKYTMPVAEVIFKAGLTILISLLMVGGLVLLMISKTRQALRCE